MAKVSYNERSWAIDVISEINIFLVSKRWYFKAAGGENTIKNKRKSLFPDVLLFQDNTKHLIVQGWELKMPDTPIYDTDLVANAIKKAEILQRDSFLLWNVRTAVLYVRKDENFVILKTWRSIAIKSRSEVKPKEILWKKLLFHILEDLNTFFEEGQISNTSTKEILSIDAVIDLMLESATSTAEEIKSKVRSSSKLDAQINTWWKSSANEYGYNVTNTKAKFPTLAIVILTDWIFKIVFTHVLKKHFNEARQIEHIQVDSSIEAAIAIIISISENCNFWNILSPNLAQNCISQTAWEQITELNQFLTKINIERIEVEILHKLLQNAVGSAKRKVAGQFSTPPALADLLTRLTIDDKMKCVFDPCCGTGTIIQKAYQLKEEYELSQKEVLDSIWASDKHSFPIQLSTLSMARPSNMGRISNIFQSDVIDLEGGTSIKFRNPNDGTIVEKLFPKIDYIVSNLPFVKNKEIKVLNPEIYAINDWIRAKIGEKTPPLSGKSDLFAYIPFYLYQLLAAEGRIGLILSNAWLGTDYGERFLRLFRYFFSVNYVLISAKGKWFSNADVVTTLLIASKKETNDLAPNNHITTFCSLYEKIEEINDIKALSEDIILGRSSKKIAISTYNQTQIQQFERLGIPWSGYFTDLNWLPAIMDKLINTSEIFDFTRGERRGWNAMFYPSKGHKIEKEYIQTVLKNLRNTPRLNSMPNQDAFCCSKSITELETLGHTGTIAWIKSFETQLNNNEKPLPEVLKKANLYWYEMTTENMADFVANVNYDKSLFIAQLNTRSFIDQRLIGFSIKETYKNENKTLYLALFNSILSMFFIESFGFGRGLGALDLRASKFERDFKILNPNVLTSSQKEAIIAAFTPITQRQRFPLEEELEMPDRLQFEKTLMDSYSISPYFSAIKNALLHLYRIRFAVKD